MFGERTIPATTSLSPSEVGRRKNIAAAQSLALKLAGNGIAVVASFVSPYRQLREEFKRHDGVVEVYVHTSALRGREAYKYRWGAKDRWNRVRTLRRAEVYADAS